VSASFDFAVLERAGAARRGRLTTAHGAIDTPAFMPVGTAGTVKAMLPESVASTGAQIILGNTYHMMLRPGAERVAELGGLHRFMNWPAPILTDSGGYQVMSLASLREIDETGVAFRSHLDGSRHVLTPERSIEIQDLLDADIAMAFDECTKFPATREETAASMALSMRWRRARALRSAHGPATASSASSRAASLPISARTRHAPCATSASTATRSAGSRSARARKRCSASSTRRCRRCRPSARAT